MVLVAGVKYDSVVGLEVGREVGPEGLEFACVGNDLAVVTATIVGVNDGGGAFRGNEVDGLNREVRVGSTVKIKVNYVPE